MVRKLNRSAAEAYSENFSRSVLDKFFSDRPVATGQDLLELTPVQQVNLLLIQRLYQRWQEETLRLRSPYFNFSHPQVQDALQTFMNTLSRHIQVEREALAPLLQASVFDTLRLMFNPLAFFDEYLRLHLDPQNLQASLRYLRMQQAITDALYEQVEEKEMKEPEFILAILETGVRSGKLPLEPVEEHIEAFAQVLPIPQGMVDEAAPAKPAPIKEDAEAPDFFSAISRSAPRQAKSSQQRQPEPEGRNTEATPAAAPLAAQAPPLAAAAAPKITPASTATEAARPEPPVKEDSLRPANTAPSPTVRVNPVAATASPARQEEELKPLNNRFEKSEKKPLYEKFEPKETTRSVLASKQRVANIRHYITLNQRFMFAKELFEGNTAAFNAALDALDTCQNLQEANQWMQQNLAHKPQWQEDSEIVQEFVGIVEHRFGA